jgi:4-diphosphocytidyl-2-C-methyl-D-erythritol kinase
VRAAWIRGRGERIEAVDVAEQAVLLVNPGVHVATPDAFRWWGEAPPAESAAGGRLFNALEAGVARNVPAVARTLAALRDLGLGAVAMSGSGATCYVLPADPTSLEEGAARIADALPEAWVYPTKIV